MTSSIEQPPRHGADLVEGVDGFSGLDAVDHSGVSEELQVAVNFLGRGVGDSPQVRSVSSRPAVPLGEVCGNGTRRRQRDAGDG